MAMLPLSGCDAQHVVDNKVTIQMKSVGQSTSDCRLQVEHTVNAMVRTMSYKRLDEANCLGKRAVSDASLSTGAHLKRPPKIGT